ncbi:hypothetical protein D3C84_951130 [compost metagenome]
MRSNALRLGRVLIGTAAASKPVAVVVAAERCVALVVVAPHEVQVQVTGLGIPIQCLGVVRRAIDAECIAGESVTLAHQVVAGEDPARAAFTHPTERLHHDCAVEATRILGFADKKTRHVGRVEQVLARSGDRWREPQQVVLLLYIPQSFEVDILRAAP